MARRVSLKGKGADLFFGDHPPGIDVAVADREDQTSDLPTADDSQLDVSHAYDPDVSAEDTTVMAAVSDAAMVSAESPLTIEHLEDAGTEFDGALSSTPNGLLPNWEGELFDTMWDRLASQASISNSFRYTAPELEEMADALYQVSKDVRARLTKQDIARLGLNVVLWDYRRRGDASWLSEFARRKRRPQEG